MENESNTPSLRFRGYTDAWGQERLGEILSERNVQHPQNDEFPLVSFTVEDGVTPKSERYDREQLVVGNKSEKKYKETRLDDIVYNPANLKFGAIGRNKLGNAVFSPIYVTFDVNRAIAYPSFVEMIVTNPAFIQSSLQYQQGTVYERMSVSPEDLLSMKVAIPSLEEQRKIGSFFDELDDSISLHQRKLSKLQEIKKSFLQNMFPAGGKDRPKIRFAGYTDAWGQERLGDHAQIIAGGTPSTAHPEYWSPKQIPWMSSGEINEKVIYETKNQISQLGYDNSSAQWVKEKSVLIALAGQGKTRGTVAINEAPITTNQSIAAAVLDEKLYYKFVYQNLEGRYDELRGISSGDGTRGGLNKQLIANISLMVPCLEEQRQIGDFLTSIDDLLSLHQRKLEKLQQIKKALLEQMFC